MAEGRFSMAVRLHIHTPDASAQEVLLNSEVLQDCQPGDILEIVPPFELPAGRLMLQVGQDSFAHAGAREIAHGAAISVVKALADLFGLKARSHVHVKRLSSVLEAELDFVELLVKEQYISRSEIWQLQRGLVNSCVHAGKLISHGGLRVQVQRLTMRAAPCLCGLITARTKLVFRSRSQHVVLLLQLAAESASFADDGELYSEKMVSFVHKLLAEWTQRGVTHALTLVLFARMSQTVASPALQGRAGPQSNPPPLPAAACSEHTDVYKVVCERKTLVDWTALVRALKEDVHRFRTCSQWRTNWSVCALAPQTSSPTAAGAAAPPWVANGERGGWEAGVSRAGAELMPLPTGLPPDFAPASTGNLFEAMNLALDALEEPQLNRELSKTGQQIVLVSPSPGLFECSPELLAVTSARMEASGIGCDLVCLGRPPRHTVPLIITRTRAPQVPPAAPSSSSGSAPLGPLPSHAFAQGAGPAAHVPLASSALEWSSPDWMNTMFTEPLLHGPMASRAVCAALETSASALPAASWPGAQPDAPELAVRARARASGVGPTVASAASAVVAFDGGRLCPVSTAARGSQQPAAVDSDQQPPPGKGFAASTTQQPSSLPARNPGVGAFSLPTQPLFEAAGQQQQQVPALSHSVGNVSPKSLRPRIVSLEGFSVARNASELEAHAFGLGLGRVRHPSLEPAGGTSEGSRCAATRLHPRNGRRHPQSQSSSPPSPPASCSASHLNSLAESGVHLGLPLPSPYGAAHAEGCAHLPQQLHLGGCRDSSETQEWGGSSGGGGCGGSKPEGPLLNALLACPQPSCALGREGCGVRCCISEESAVQPAALGALAHTGSREGSAGGCSACRRVEFSDGGPPARSGSRRQSLLAAELSSAHAWSAPLDIATSLSHDSGSVSPVASASALASSADSGSAPASLPLAGPAFARTQLSHSLPASSSNGGGGGVTGEVGGCEGRAQQRMQPPAQQQTPARPGSTPIPSGSCGWAVTSAGRVPHRYQQAGGQAGGLCSKPTCVPGAGGQPRSPPQAASAGLLPHSLSASLLPHFGAAGAASCGLPYSCSAHTLSIATLSLVGIGADGLGMGGSHAHLPWQPSCAMLPSALSNPFLRHPAPAARLAPAPGSRAVSARQWLHVVNSTLYSPSERMWMSLCEPALLPLETDEVPPTELDRDREFDLQLYTLAEFSGDAQALLQELICQRLEQDFQLIAQPAAGHGQGQEPEGGGSLKRSYYLCMGHSFQLLSCVDGPAIEVKIWRRKARTELGSLGYSYLVCGAHREGYEQARSLFALRGAKAVTAQHALGSAVWNWNHLDFMIAEGGSVLREWMEPRLLSFCLVQREEQQGQAGAAGADGEGEPTASPAPLALPVCAQPAAAAAYALDRQSSAEGARLTSCSQAAAGCEHAQPASASPWRSQTPAPSSDGGRAPGAQATPVAPATRTAACALSDEGAAAHLAACAEAAHLPPPAISLAGACSTMGAAQSAGVASAEPSPSKADAWAQAIHPDSFRRFALALAPRICKATDVESLDGAQPLPGAPRRPTARIVENVLSEGAGRRTLTTVVELDAVLEPWRAWSMCFKWRASVGVTVDELVSLLRRRARQAGLRLVQVPAALALGANGRAMGGPFSPPFTVPCARALVPAALRALCAADGPFDFALEREGAEGRLAPGARYVQRSGVALLEVCEGFLIWVSNTLHSGDEAGVRCSLEMLALFRAHVALESQRAQPACMLPRARA